MALPLRVCLYDISDDDCAAFFGVFRELSGIQIVAQSTQWNDVQQCLTARQVDVVAVNLGHTGPAGVTLVHRVAELAADVGIIGIGAVDDPDTIIAAMRAGCAQFVRYPIELDDLRAALERMRATNNGAAPEARRIVLMSSSGGAGATTLAANLCLELAQITKRRCGLVDLDLEFGDLACMLDVVPKNSIADVCHPGAEIDETILEQAFIEAPGNIALLARPERFDDIAAVTPEFVDQLLRIAAHMFPYLVLDAPRQLSALNATAMSSADRVLIVTQLSVPHLRNATRVYHAVLAMGVQASHVEVVLNRSNASFENVKPEDVESHFGRKVFAVVPNDYKRITAARDLGRPMVSYAPSSPARAAIQQLAQQLVADYSQPEQAASASSGGLFGRLLGRGSKAKAATATRA